MKSRTITLIAASMILSMALVAPPANAAEGGYTVKTGFLTCVESSGWGFVFGSSRDVKCSYSTKSGRVEYYTGSVSKFGADIGYLKSAVIVWAVAATTNDLHPGALAGEYGGATASVSLGAGAGANVLVGGFKKSIALQPVSFEGQTGLNVAAGVAALNLKYLGEKRPTE
jgi:Protein of unknown function (DUF992)